MTLKRYSFSKEERLKSRKEISRIFDDGIFLFEKNISMVYILCEEQESSNIKIAVSVPKKHIKRAVNRNRIKRQIREIYRLNKSIIYDYLDVQTCHIIFIYKSKEMINFDGIKSDVLCLMTKLQKNILRNSI